MQKTKKDMKGCNNIVERTVFCSERYTLYNIAERDMYKRIMVWRANSITSSNQATASECRISMTMFSATVASLGYSSNVIVKAMRCLNWLRFFFCFVFLSLSRNEMADRMRSEKIGGKGFYEIIIIYVLSVSSS